MNLSEEELQEVLKNPDMAKVNPILLDSLPFANPDLARRNYLIPDPQKPNAPQGQKKVLSLVTGSRIPSKAKRRHPHEDLRRQVVELATPSKNKFHAKRTWSELCQRIFDSKAEARRGEELFLLQRAGDIENLEYQIPFRLCEEPKITVTLDFCYDQYPVVGKIYEDVKGVLTRDSRTKYAWLKEKHGIEVNLVR